MSIVDAAADNVKLPERLCGLRQRLLFGRPDDVDRHMLSERTGAERPEQEPMQADHYHYHSERTTVRLRIGSHPDGERQVLRARECDHGRRLLFGRSQSERPHQLPGSLRERLYADG